MRGKLARGSKIVVWSQSGQVTISAVLVSVDVVMICLSFGLMFCGVSTTITIPPSWHNANIDLFLGCS